MFFFVHFLSLMYNVACITHLSYIACLLCLSLELYKYNQLILVHFESIKAQHIDLKKYLKVQIRVFFEQNKQLEKHFFYFSLFTDDDDTDKDGGTSISSASPLPAHEIIEHIVKSPPEPTRVKSPEQIIMRSPDPVNWTVPLDTGKTFTVTQNVRDGMLGC